MGASKKKKMIFQVTTYYPTVVASNQDWETLGRTQNRATRQTRRRNLAHSKTCEMFTRSGSSDVCALLSSFNDKLSDRIIIVYNR